MRFFQLFPILLLLCACATAPVKNVGNIRTTVVLSPELSVPVDIPIAFYASNEELSRKVQTSNGYYSYKTPAGYNMKKAMGFVFPEVFVGAEALKPDSKFKYLFKVSSEPKFKASFTTYSVSLTLDVVDQQGAAIFSIKTSGAVSGAGAGNVNAFHNAYAKALKEASYQFLSHLGVDGVNQAISDSENLESTFDVRSLIAGMKPVSSGTGFYINRTGDIVTAAHVTYDCLALEVRSKGVTSPVTAKVSSRLLDLAVVTSGEPVEGKLASLGGSSAGVSLGQPVFTTGFPLANILADYPSLTIGNVSSMGGLKGAKGQFQFSTPIQPGNSGGPLVSYKGKVVGVVASSLNQRMMLDATGTTSQNLNFGIGSKLLTKFLDKNDIRFGASEPVNNFEAASALAVDYTVQVLCYR